MQNSTEQSKAHRLFFAKATSRGVFNLQYNDYWDEKLGESGADVMHRFIAEGLIAPAPIKDVIDKQFTVEQLKPHLKKLGLKLGGKKFELLERIIVADPEWAQAQTKDGALYYRTREDQVFPRDEWQGIDNRKVDPAPFVQIARSIAAKLPTGERERAIINVLYGNASYEPKELETIYGSAYERDLVHYREAPFIVGLQIIPAKNDSCDGACKISGYYRLEDAPDYPFEVCTGEFCNCYWICIFEDEAMGIEWKTPTRRSRCAGPPIPTLRAYSHHSGNAGSPTYSATQE